MTVVKKTPEKLGNHDLCPGCGHGIVLRLIIVNLPARHRVWGVVAVFRVIKRTAVDCEFCPSDIGFCIIHFA